MRIRHKPYARPELAAWKYHIDLPANHIGRWNALFVNSAAPIHLELGCGKGAFLAGRGLREPEVNFLGIDLKSEMLVVAKRTIERVYSDNNKLPDNILLTSFDIEKISGIISKNDNVTRIYINFCNPWYKAGHAKHRLTHPRQLLQYRDILGPEGEIWFKTDDSLLFDDSLRYFDFMGFNVLWSTTNLHKTEPSWNVRTEHEQLFSESGISIKACIAKLGKLENIDRDAIMKMKNI